MKRIIFAMMLALLLVIVTASGVSARGATKTSTSYYLDLNGDGISEYRYHVITGSGTYTAPNGVTYRVTTMQVDYIELDEFENPIILVGYEKWNSYAGITVDNFEPWTYKFPALRTSKK